MASNCIKVGYPDIIHKNMSRFFFSWDDMDGTLMVIHKPCGDMSWGNDYINISEEN